MARQLTSEEVKQEGAKELGALLKKVNTERPKPEDIAAINRVLEQVPTVALKLGDLAGQVELQCLEGAFKKDKGFMLILSKRMELMRRDMGHDDADLITQGLINHVVLCWLRLHLCELRYESNLGNGQTIAQATHWEKTLTTHQKRYLRAVEGLARFRRLMQPQPSPLTLALVKAQIGVK